VTEALVARAAELVRERYVFPDRGTDAAARLLARLAEGAYAGLDLPELCDRLTEDLRSVCPDRHLRVAYRAEPRLAGSSAEDLDQYWAQARLRNHGVARVERLAGNVGYLDLRAIDQAAQTAATIAAAMAVLQYTSALLLDLRGNTGGAPSGVVFLCSYFVGPEPVHLNDVYRRASETTQQFWSYAHLPGPRYLNRPVFVLTGPRTFSGGEEIAYNLQQLKRATLIGETTRGGAHPVEPFWLDPHVTIRIPTERSVNPISGTNWEGVGVVPDVAVPAEQAYEEAYGRALRAVLEQSPDDAVHREIREEALAQILPPSSA
jgi:C-terminal processing protease CtpA/Prc